MLTAFTSRLETQFPFLKGKRLLVACSGGVDSVVMAHLCVSSGLHVTLAHCNFKLRGSESDADEAFVVRLGKDLGIDVLTKTFDTYQYAETHRGSVQMAARELRYQWFNDLMLSAGYDFVLTAHHADDDLETFIINLSRGTGLDGLLAIPEVNEKVIRPLLHFSREDILNYAKAHKIEWREDSSNAESKYLRNKIRHEIVPRIKELHPTFLQNFIQSQTYLSQTQNLVKNYLDQIRNELFQTHNGVVKIKAAELLALKPLDAIIFGLFKDYGFTDYSAIKDLLTATSGKQVVSKTHRLLKDRDVLILSEIKTRVNDVYPVFINENKTESPLKLELEVVDKLNVADSNTIFLDKEKLNFPLELRKWEKGDYFYPFGMHGKKKLSKFFKDEKVDVISKEDQWLLCSDNQIVWVVGRRADERFKVDDSTEHIVKITLNV